MKKISVLAIAACLALGTAAYAAPVTVVNNSFEANTNGNDGNSDFGTITGWTTGTDSTGYAATENPGPHDGTDEYTGDTGAGTPSGADGSAVAYLNLFSAGNTNLFQDVGALQANTTYTLTLAIGQRLDRTNGAVNFGLYNAAAGVTTPFTTGTALAASTGVSSVAGSFQDFTTTFTTGATVTGDLYIDLANTNSTTIQSSFDNVRLDATAVSPAVPEPSTWALMLGGLGVVALFRRFRNLSSQS